MFVISLMSSLVFASTSVVSPTSPECKGLPDPMAARALANDNRVAAGTLKDGVLTVRLVARPTAWHPEGAKACGIRVHAFAEEGKQAQIPGPLLRVRVGTEVRVTVRNELGLPLKLRGLFERKPQTLGLPADRQLIESSGIELAAGESREIRFRATVPGNFYYWGRTPFDTIAAFPFRVPGLPVPLFSPFEDSQLGGALIVDPEGGSPPDRVLVITHWAKPGTPVEEAGLRQINALNGLSWPHTERFNATVGDTLRWRVLNVGTAPHTMHLHGFYFRVLSQGGLSAFDSIFARPQQQSVVSEFMAPNRTMTMEWVPERPGNWLFHCHFIAHMRPAQRIARVFDPEPATAVNGHDSHQEGHEMAGLVMGVAVKSSGPAERTGLPVPKRQLRLFASERPRVFGEEPGYGFVLQEGQNAPARDSIRIPGTPIVLTKGEPVQITVFNRLRFPLAVHWHGIELESYYDGVPDFSGAARRLAPAMASGDSFVVRMTPPRAGTFFYHIHSEQADELNSGLYGALIVLDPAQKSAASGERTFVLSAGGRRPRPNQVIFVNGTTKPDAIEMKVGDTQRWRFISIPANGQFDVRVTGGTTAPVWRQVARDGADLPAQQLVETAAQTRIPVGIAMDFEFTARTTGDYVLEVDLPAGPEAVAGFATRVPIRVVAGSEPGQDQAEQRKTLERALALLNDESKWRGSQDVSDLLWALFCAVDSDTQNEACADSEHIPPTGPANPVLLEQAREIVRRALARSR
jgi:FtsP/CotA-like multicopper oxidase with cupredoxin domain